MGSNLELVFSRVLAVAAIGISCVLHLVHSMDEIDAFRSFIDSYALVLFIVLLFISAILSYNGTLIVFNLLYRRTGEGDPAALFWGLSAFWIVILLGGIFAKSIAHWWKRKLREYSFEDDFAVIGRHFRKKYCSLVETKVERIFL
jgi:hypothetical protein